MIIPETILARTATGSALLQTADSDLSRTERLLLIMVNGQISVGDISNKLYSIPLRRLIEALDYLTGRGLISQDKTQNTTPTSLKRHELEAFLRTDELDPTTAMIANFELQAALNDSAHASVIVTQTKTSSNNDLDQRIQAKIQTAKPLERLLNTPKAEAAKVVFLAHDQTVPTTVIAANRQSFATRSGPQRRPPTQKKQRLMPFLCLAVFAIVWVGVIWYVRHR